MDEQHTPETKIDFESYLIYLMGSLHISLFKVLLFYVFIYVYAWFDFDSCKLHN